MIEGKVWGTTELIFKNSNCEVHRIFIGKGGFCSMHKHEHKHNLFYVDSGHLRVTVEKTDYKLTDTTILLPGQKTSVKPGQFHKFEALEETYALEIYYTEPISSDIIRKDCGGINGTQHN